ncbi:hypothetical protein Tco_0930736 [Tanacetum coccineum]
MDSGSSCEVIYEHYFSKLKPSIKSLRVDSKVPLVGFLGEHSWPIGEVPLEITIGDSPLSRTETLNFVIERNNSPQHTNQKNNYAENGYRGLHDLWGHQSSYSSRNWHRILDIRIRQDAKERIIVNSKYPEQTVIIGKQLPTNFKERLQDLLRSNANVFAWTHADMTGIPRTIMVGGKPFNTKHKLNKYKHIKPVKQKKRELGLDRSATAYKEVEELTKAGILRNVKNKTCVATPVMIKKSDKGWRMCVDFTDIHKACPKDRRMNILLQKNAFRFEKHQSYLPETVDKVFNDQIRQNLEAYVYDMVIKSTFEEDMLKDIQET